MGMASAYFLSKIVKMTALIIGGYFLSLQALSSQGFITINWQKVRNFIIELNMHKAVKAFGVSSLGFSFGFYLVVRRELNKML